MGHGEAHRRGVAGAAAAAIAIASLASSGCLMPGRVSRPAHTLAYVADVGLAVVGSALVIRSADCLSFQICGGDRDVPNLSIVIGVPLLVAGVLGGGVNGLVPSPDEPAAGPSAAPP